MFNDMQIKVDYMYFHIEYSCIDVNVMIVHIDDTFLLMICKVLSIILYFLSVKGRKKHFLVFSFSYIIFV